MCYFICLTTKQLCFSLFPGVKTVSLHLLWKNLCQIKHMNVVSTLLAFLLFNRVWFLILKDKAGHFCHTLSLHLI